MFVGFFGCLFGQAFFGKFSIVDTLTGVSSLLAGGLGWLGPRNVGLRLSVVICCLGGVLGSGMDVFQYYSQVQVAGNSFGWDLTGPFVAGLMFIGYSACCGSEFKRPDMIKKG